MQKIIKLEMRYTIPSERLTKMLLTKPFKFEGIYYSVKFYYNNFSIIDITYNNLQFQAVSQISEMNKDRRYDQLMHLLEKSSIYTGFLLDRLKAEEAVKAQQEEKVKKQAEKSATSNRGRRNSKRKKTAVSDVIDKQVFTLNIYIYLYQSSVGTEDWYCFLHIMKRIVCPPI